MFTNIPLQNDHVPCRNDRVRGVYSTLAAFDGVRLCQGHGLHYWRVQQPQSMDVGPAHV